MKKVNWTYVDMDGVIAAFFKAFPRYLLAGIISLAAVAAPAINGSGIINLS